MSPEFRFRSILLPTDFSDASDRAARLARGLATHFCSKLHVVHAVWQRDYEWDEAVSSTGTNENSSAMRSQEFVAANGLEAVMPEVIVMPGSPTEVVQTISAEMNPDLLVLGTNGLPWPAKLLFGTYSEQIYRNARCPVLTVGPHVRSSKCSGEFKSIVFLLNPESELTPSALQTSTQISPLQANSRLGGDLTGALGSPLQYAIALARAFDARLTVGCVLPRPHQANGEEIYRVQHSLKIEKQAELLRLLEDMQPALPHPPEVAVEIGHISEGIIKIALRSNADLIVKAVRPPEPHPNGGYTYPISVNAPCPVLTVGGITPKKPPARWV